MVEQLRWLTTFFFLSAVLTGWLSFSSTVRLQSILLDAGFIVSIGGFLICFLAVLSKRIEQLT